MKNKTPFIITTIAASVLIVLLYISNIMPTTQQKVPDSLNQYLSSSIQKSDSWIIEKTGDTFTIRNISDGNEFILANPGEIRADDLLGKEVQVTGTLIMNNQSLEDNLKNTSAVMLNVDSIKSAD